MLLIFSGLPGTGKTTLAKLLSRDLSAAYFRIDTIEQCMKDTGLTMSYDESYQVAGRLAEENLKLGQTVIADSTNPVRESREAWWRIAQGAGVLHLDIEVICSDKAIHQERVESRTTDIQDLKLPTWQSVCHREYLPWGDNHRLIIDTAHKTELESYEELRVLLKAL